MGDAKKEYYIYVQGEQVAVSREIYCAYYEEYDHERYLDRRGQKREISSDLLQKQGNLINFVGLSEHSMEYQMIEKERMALLYQALKQLDAEERWLIDKLYFDECSEKEIALILGISQQAVSKKKKKVLKKLGIILK